MSERRGGLVPLSVAARSRRLRPHTRRAHHSFVDWQHMLQPLIYTWPKRRSCFYFFLHFALHQKLLHTSFLLFVAGPALL